MRVVPSPTPGEGRRKPHRCAFTLIETMAAMVIISVAITAMCELLAAGTRANVAGNELTTAVNLANTVHEIAIELAQPGRDAAVIGPWQNVWDLDGQNFSPPIDAHAEPILDYASWTQRVSVEPVDGGDVAGANPSLRRGSMARLKVEIYHEGRQVHSATWLVAANHSPEPGAPPLRTLRSSP
jgi:prepilin-type N-terminal cleavage/methylation domain-containing protein